MRKLKLFFACLLVTLFSIGQMWAEDIELVSTLNATAKVTLSATATTIGDVVNLTGTKHSSYSAPCFNYNATSGVDLRFYKGSTVTFAMVDANAEITQIEFKKNSTTASSLGSLSADVGTLTNNVWEGNANAVTFSYPADASSNLTGQIYIINLTYSAGSSTKTLSSIEVSGEPTKTSYYAGQDFDPAGLTVTGTYSDQSQSAITSGITWSYNPAQALELNQTSIGVTATVGNISSDEYNVTVTVTEAPAAVNYEKVTSEPSDWSGEYILVYESGSNAYVYTGVDANNNYAAATISNDVIAIPEGAATLTIASMEGGYSIRLGGGTNDGKYISGTSGTNTTKFTADPVANTLSIANGSAVITAGNTIRFNSGSSTLRFRYYGATAQQPVQLYKKVEGTVKPAAGIEYAAADQKKLTKLGDAFTAPTLTNPNSLTVSYASNNTAVADVDASTGAVTINAAGVAVITASFAGNDDYKEGSASYTIGVTAHAGTEADPYVAADAKIAIDVKGTIENAYASGLISNIVTTSSNFDAEAGFITFYFSADGTTTGQQIEAYKCFDLNSAKFTAVTDVVTGATVVVTGTLKKYNSTYEFDQNCHLVSYEAPAVPKQSIANDQAHPYTVAQAITYAADGVTYDLDDFVYVQGVVYDVKSFSSTNGTLDIYIKDANAENQFELFKCAGINDGSATTPFEALTDVQVGDEVIAYGQLTVYNTMSELKSGNYLVELTRPVVAVSSVSLPATETVEVGSTVTLTATVLPENASNKAITWTVESGDTYASVENGVVTGLVAGEAVIRATSQADGTKYAECTVTVTAADPTKHVVTFDATVDLAEDGVKTLTKSNVTIETDELDGVNSSDNPIEYYQTFKNGTLTISCSAGNITKIEFTCESSNPVSGFGTVDPAGLNTTTGVWAGNASSVEFTANEKQVRINTITVTYKEDNRAASGLAWSTDAVELTVGDEFTAPTLSNPNSIAASAITIASDNTDLAVVNDGVVSLVSEATGEATITATFAGNDDYKPATVSYTITVNAAAPPVLTDYYEKVTATANIAEGTYLIVYEDESVAFNGGLETLDAKNNYIEVVITNDNKIGVTSATEAATVYINPTAGTIQAANGKYIGVTSNSNGLKQSDNADAYENAFTIDGDGNAVISAVFESANMTMRYNKASDQKRFRYFGSGQQPIALYKLANEVLKQDPGISWDPSSYEMTLSSAITPGDYPEPVLIIQADLGDNPLDFITLSSDNESLATINKTNDGQIKISWVPDATGTVHFTASYPGNETYKAVTATCTIKVNPANSIYVSPSLYVNFGSVEKDAAIEDKVITVTLTEVAAATLTLAGDGASAFSISPATALTASGDITISASSATAGTFAATLTISDDAGLATSRVVNLSLTVTEPEIVDDLSGTWVLATAVPAIGEKFIVAGTYNEVTKTMGAQNTNNRAAVASTLAEGVLTPGEGTKVFTLVDAGEGKYAIKASNNKYLTASGTGTKNYLTEAADYEAANAKWTISISEGIASVVASSSNRNDLQYNKSNPGLFSCYATDGQTAIQLYVLQSVTPPEPPTPTYETVRTGLEVGRHYTVCLSKNITAIKGATFWNLQYKNTANTEVYLVEETAPEAGKPYIFQATADKLEVVCGNETADSPVENGALRGTFEGIDADQFAALTGEVYLLIQNAIRPRTTGNYLAANRAYVRYDLLTTPSSANFAPGKNVKSMPMQPKVATGMENGELINGENGVQKVLINGQLFILRGDKMYDVTGKIVK